MGQTREALIEATKHLLAEDGYGSTSPRDILARSGAGQGSLYHHFRGKSDLAAAALHEVSAEMRTAVDDRLDAAADPVVAVLDWLQAPRDALRGCRLGRLAAEPAIGEAVIAAPIAAYFHHVQGRLAARLGEAAAAGRLTDGMDPGEVAASLVAVVQGGYVLARATDDPAAMRRAQAGAAALLRACCRPVEGDNR
ncbi:TetR/AcrR family transcriptional regulator [Actinoplanes sp. NEAU-A12]|uniref:TetR/AcrR family transcriptional regulator n=1 Tax=Actinoplanes sandaracinus TaxID=3045177 RepID=A0ABT6WVM6_9ACTN|nr:TetR/AcrR family transcriptional regulator [Actinoplanes sandaracinus]MDI6103686.1 TetR/AcrR family transcriptional regulator [Actinoplanes sandaracinus]